MDWIPTWLLTIGVVVVCLSGLEAGWRRVGFRPSCNDTDGLWASQLALVHAQPDAVVLIGDSRTQLGIDPRVLSAELSGRLVVQLGVPTASPVPLLHHLAAQENFCGTVVCGVNPLIFFEASRGSERAIIKKLRRQGSESWISQWEHPLRAWCQAHAAILRSDLMPSAILPAWLKGRSPQQLPIRIRPDRYTEADYEHYPRLHERRRMEQEFAETFGQVSSPEQMDDFLAELSKSVQTIQERGGRVVFLAMPATGPVRAAESLRYPASAYWNRLSALPATLCLNPMDSFPDSALECADFCHLDQPVAAKFSAHLGKLLAAQPSVTNLQ